MITWKAGQDSDLLLDKKIISHRRSFYLLSMQSHGVCGIVTDSAYTERGHEKISAEYMSVDRVAMTGQGW